MKLYPVRTLADLRSRPFRCVNCGASMKGSAALHCSSLCGEVANLVRYIRSCLADGRWSRPDVRDAVWIRLVMIADGGYDAKGRKISAELRSQVKARDQGKCRACGQPGNEIDHIAGSSAALDNLQLLCKTCHMEKTKAGFVKGEWVPEARERHQHILDRAEATRPLQFCDSPTWGKHWRRLKAERALARSGQ
jgi:5-methylcytosine-specific restriction endonuclease McrA